MSNKELLRCPFCGSEAKYENIDGYHYIICDECGARNFGFSKEQAFDEWNSRVQCVDSEENVVENSNYPEKPDSSNSSEKPNSSKGNHCKDENATCKKNLQLSRSDIDKMVKLNFDEYIPEEWMDLSIYGCCFFKLSIYKYGEHYSPYINDEKADEAFETLEEAKDFTKKQVVNFICSALGIKDLG